MCASWASRKRAKTTPQCFGECHCSVGQEIPRCSLPCSQQPAAALYLEPYKSTQHSPILFQFHFNITVKYSARSLKFGGFVPNSCKHFLPCVSCALPISFWFAIQILFGDELTPSTLSCSFLNTSVMACPVRLDFIL